MRVAVVHERVGDGARADELDVLAQAGAVRGALERLGHEATGVEVDFGLDRALQALRAARADAAFNLVESLGGRGSLVHLGTALLEASGLPFTGSPSTPTFLTACKTAAKRVLRDAGLPTAPWFEERDLAGESADVRGDWIVKSVWEQGSVGLHADNVLRSPSHTQVRERLAALAPRLGGEAFVEGYVEGRELNVALLATPEGPRVLPIAEIRFAGDWSDRPRILSWEAKWDEDSRDSRATPRRFDFPPGDAALLEELTRLARECWRAFDLAGHVRVDFRLDDEGRPFILEVNTNPCLSPDAGFTAMLERAGESLDTAVAALLDDALRRRAGR